MATAGHWPTHLPTSVVERAGGWSNRSLLQNLPRPPQLGRNGEAIQALVETRPDVADASQSLVKAIPSLAENQPAIGLENTRNEPGRSESNIATATKMRTEWLVVVRKVWPRLRVDSRGSKHCEYRSYRHGAAALLGLLPASLCVCLELRISPNPEILKAREHAAGLGIDLSPD